MIYALKCPSCMTVDDYHLGMNDVDAVVICEKCGAEVSRRSCRVYEPTFQIQGDTVPRGCNYDYWDGNLGVRVRSKAHRAEEMKRQGLREYAPDPEMKKFRDEARYIKSHAPKGDLEASAAAKSLHKQAQTLRTSRQVDRVMNSAKVEIPNID